MSHHGHQAGQQQAAFVDKDDIRSTFALALSAMYKAEVPLYGDLVQIVQSINSQRDAPESPERLNLERHGAIRLGTAQELQTMRRIFALIGMQPVGYYDLSIAGLPMHATCFRPINNVALARNPFRVFTTVLRPELLKSTAARDTALALLDQRKIFSGELLEILDEADAQSGRLTQHQAESFITQAMLTFGWRSTAASTRAEYELLKSEHPILADIACFRSAHINHLTPRTLDIAAAQKAMSAAGMAVKSRIEGPPERNCPILLRQTSFLALEESIRFRVDESSVEDEWIDGSHKARFGEIEQRGAAVTGKGRQLYDQLLEKAMVEAANQQANVDDMLNRTFKEYPDTWADLRRQGLVYFKYRCTGKSITLSDADVAESDVLLEHLLAADVVEADPITYEDFLPLSAAGIFQSNLQSNGGPSKSMVSGNGHPQADKKGFEKALGCPVMDADELYARAQRESLEACAAKLNLYKL
ncbi:DUF1338 domain protein [Aspergillus karnatakaensis]|uniref:DUF1338 domain protein n=1 Tax=Aspergillus karnatakaensis TaxID=1810916 RepID=UPI003CCD4EE2